MSLDAILEYPCRYDLDILYERLILYRYLLALYLCPGPTIVGGPLQITYREETKTSKINWIKTELDPVAPLEKKAPYLIKPLYIMGDISHDALLVFDLRDKIYEYIDSTGYPSWYLPVLQSVQVYAQIVAPGYRPVLSPCPLAPQFLEGRGSCSDWALLYLFLRCNREESFEKIQALLGEIPFIQLRRLIDGWRCFLWDLVRTQRLPEIRVLLQFIEKELPLESYEARKRIYQQISQQNIPGSLSVAYGFLKEKIEEDPSLEDDIQDRIDFVYLSESPSN